MHLKIPKYKLILASIDFLLINFSYLLAYHLTINRLTQIKGLNYLFILFSFLISGIFLFIYQTQNLYKVNIFLTRALQLVLLLKSSFYALLMLVVLLFILNFPFGLFSRLFVAVFILLLIFTEAIFRIGILKPLYEKFSKNKILNRKVIIVGAGKSGKKLAAKLLVENQVGIDIIGFADDNVPKGTKISDKFSVIGSVDEIIYMNGNLEVDEVIISIDNISYENLIKTIDKLNLRGFFVRVNSELFKTIPENILVEKYGDIPVINTTPQVLSTYTLFFKSVFDKVVALIGLILLMPFFVIVAIIIKLTSKGPVFYKQERIGKDGKKFMFLKFRSMTVEKEDDKERIKMMLRFMKENKAPDSNSTKIINERRVTKIGKFLRKYSLDELPQLINVLKGEMSLVGPRPCLPYEYENYEEWQKERVRVLPGCTGLWQVYGRSKVNFKDSVVMDLYYINNMSPWLDLQLLIKTIPVLLTGKGGK